MAFKCLSVQAVDRAVAVDVALTTAAIIALRERSRAILKAANIA
jgi:hypothetical protein